MSFNSDVLVWFIEQIVSTIGLIISTAMCIIVIRELKAMRNELAPILLFFMCAVHIMSALFYFCCLLSLTILPLFRYFEIRADPKTTCLITFIFVSALGAGLLLVVINLFFERLRLSFSGTNLAVSSLCNFLFRIILTTVWAFIGVSFLYATDPTPFNIHSQSFDVENGVTCIARPKSQKHAMLIFAFVAATMSIENLIVLYMFVAKLYGLLQEMAVENYNATELRLEFLVVMKQQTMLVGIAVTSSVICWSLQSALQIGQIFANCDIIASVFIYFLTFKNHKKYFNLLKCDALSSVCCKWFEKVVSINTSTAELKLGQCVSQSGENDAAKSSNAASCV